MSLRAQFIAFDDRLLSVCVPPLTPWWRQNIGRWLDAYERGHVLELWGCVGRGAAKSTAIYKLALFFALFGDFAVPPGERHFAIVLSRLKEEAAKGIDIIAAWLRMLGVGHTVAGDVIEIKGQPRGIRVVAASVAATSGWRAFFIGKDERSKWPADGATEQDAEEIDTSATAMTATHELAPVISFGSAWGAFGAFFDAIMSGTDDRHFVLGPTPTWIAAPHITEESTRRKERDERRWKREYKCEFQAGVGSALDAEFVDRAFAQKDVIVEAGQPVVVIDPSSGKADAYAWGVVRRCITATGREKIVFDLIDGLSGRFWDQVWSDQVVARIAIVARDHGANEVHSDQREEYALRSAFRQHGLRFRSHDWTSGRKIEAVARLRRWLADETLILPPHEQLRREMMNFEEKISPQSGELTYGARGRAHDDFVALLLTATMVDMCGAFRRERAREPGASVGFVRTGRSWDDQRVGDSFPDHLIR